MNQSTLSIAPSSIDDETQTSSYRWVICALLFLATTINYMDRQVLGILAPTLQAKIGWNELQYGHIVVAFQAAYAIGLISFGRLIDRYGTKTGYSLAIIVWSIAACLHGAVRSVTGFGVVRFMLGIGESGNFPAAIKTIAEWFDPSERALATGLFNCGSNAGAIVAPLIVPWIALTWGWQAAFISLGLLGLLWVVLWLIVYRRPPNLPAADSTVATSSRLGWIQLLSFSQTWAYNIPSALVCPIWWFYLYWLPKFFDARYGLSLSKLGPPLMTVYGMALVGSLLGGFMPQWLLRHGRSLNFSRKISMLICAVLTIPVIFVTQVGDVHLATLTIGLAAAAMQGWAAKCYSMVSDLFPKSAVASVVGMGSALGSVTGILFAEVAGIVLNHSGSYRILFFAAGASMPLAITTMHLLAPNWRPVKLSEVDHA